MRLVTNPIACLIIAAGIAAGFPACASSSPGVQSAAHVPRVPSRAAGPVLAVRGREIVDSEGNGVVLRGVAFGNRVWSDVAVPREHHSAVDYQRVRDMGMNSIRFYLNHLTFENPGDPTQLDRAEGWEWLDQNVTWAREHGVYLILNLHVPPGGFQSLGKGEALWRDDAAQQRFIAVWQAIADRYRGEPAIAGYDLLNEPVVTENISQWQKLAERTIAAIREVDPEHIVFVERVNAVGGDWGENATRNFFRVGDPNVVYEFHFYKPFHFTHQNAAWVDFAGVDQHYPNDDIAEVDWFNLDYRTATYGSPTLPAGTTDWAHYEGAPFTVEDPTLVVGKPALQCNSVAGGTAYFDDIVLERMEDGAVSEELWREPLDTKRGWYFWSQDESGKAGEQAAGHADAGALFITGTRSYANLGADPLRFPTPPGATYRLSGWMRGTDIPASAVCQIQLQFYASKVPVMRRNRAFLAQELDAYLAWGKASGVPLYLGEWGAIRFAFEDERGGLRWASDMLDLLLERNLSFAYHDYHESAFGIYYGDEGLPDPKQANAELIELFQTKLGGEAAKAQIPGNQTSPD